MYFHMCAYKYINTHIPAQTSAHKCDQYIQSSISKKVGEIFYFGELMYVINVIFFSSRNMHFKLVLILNMPLTMMVIFKHMVLLKIMSA